LELAEGPELVEAEHEPSGLGRVNRYRVFLNRFKPGFLTTKSTENSKNREGRIIIRGGKILWRIGLRRKPSFFGGGQSGDWRSQVLRIAEKAVQIIWGIGIA
jgi:hypothetical protein